MKTKSEKTLPKMTDRITNGGVYRQKVRCGKPRCKCARGEPHFAYYFFTRCNGKLLKYHVRKGDVDHFSNLVKTSVRSKQLERPMMKSVDELYKGFRLTLAGHAAVIYGGGIENGVEVGEN